jgi:hypothetical protein
MPTGLTSESTSFTLDNMGRFLCNTAQEALTSAGVDAGIGTPPADARPFDVIVVGGGTFGGVIAQHLFFNDATRSRRILVVERGPFVLPEHVQNLPFLGGLPDSVRPWEKTFSGDNPGLRICLGGRSLEWGGWSPELLSAELAGWPASVVTALTSSVPVVDRPAPDPCYFQQSAEQIGSADTNDFMYGPLHVALRQRLAAGLGGASAGSIAANLPLTSWPDHGKVRYASTPPTDPDLTELLGLPGGGPPLPRQQLLDLLKLEAPLAVQSRTDPGQFPTNKFSALPLLVAAARGAGAESFPYDQLKRVTVVPGWHVQELVTETLATNEVRVTGVRIVRGPNNTVAETLFVPLAANGVVILAQGTVETTRLARQTFRDSLSWRAFERMGTNLFAHLRSNLTIRVPRTSVPGLPAVPRAMQVSALFVKGKAAVAGRDRYFHLQITASALPPTGVDSEAELFKKIPDLDNIQKLKRSDDATVVITLRGIGEMAARNPDSTITEAGTQDFGRPKALVALGDAKVYAEAIAAGGPLPAASVETKIDVQVWDAMDQLADEVAVMFGNAGPFEILVPGGGVINVPAGATPATLRTVLPYVRRRDGLGTTHHEGGSLRMGDAVADAVTDGFGRVYDTTNCFCASPALFPMGGSPNPMLTGVALARRTGDYLSHRLSGVTPAGLLPSPAPFSGDGAPWQVLFDGTLASFNRWRRVGSAAGANNEPASDFRYIDGQIVTVGAGDFAVFFYEPTPFSDFVLKLQCRVFAPGVNSGIFVRIRDPQVDPPQAIIDRIKAEPNVYRSDLATDWQLFQGNRAWSAVHSGFEVQIDDDATGDPRRDFYGRAEPNGLRKNRTGAIYKIPAGDPTGIPGQTDASTQLYQPGPVFTPRPWADPGGWFEFEVRVQGNAYEVWFGAVGGAKTRTSAFTNTDGLRGVPKSTDPKSGYIGLQAYGGRRVAFRNIQVKPL